MGMMIRRAIKRIRDKESATAPKEVIKPSNEEQKVERTTAKRGRKAKR